MINASASGWIDKFFSDQKSITNPVIENTDVYDEDVNCENIPTEDTLSILDKYVEESEFELDKNTIKKLLREFYREALEVE